MRELFGHRVNPANDKLTVEALDYPGPGGASHAYRISGFMPLSNPSYPFLVEAGYSVSLVFQNGAINEVGVNGITHEALIEILVDRLLAFQSGPYASIYNSEAVSHLIQARDALQRRTKDRMAKGIEGTMAVDASVLPHPVPEDGG